MAVPNVVTLLPPPPPSSWKVLVALALGHAVRDFFDLMLCLCFAGLWLGCAGLALAVLGHRVCGDGSLVVAMALDASTRGIDLGRLLPSALLMRVWLMDEMGYRFEISRDANKSAVEIILTLLPLSADFGLLAHAFFAMLELAGDLVVSSARGSQAAERVGSVIKDVGALGAMAMLCFVVLPAFARFAWRMKLLAC